MSDENWRLDAACFGQVTDLFYPEPGTKGAAKQANEVKAFCRICSVTSDCLEYALKNEEVFGIWGGLTPKEREKIRRERSILAKDVSIRTAKQNDGRKVQN